SFGLVVSEAMAAELPVVASIHAAATHDLIQEGINGFLIDPHDTETAAQTVLTVLDLSQEDRARIGRAAYDRVKICDPEQAAARMMTFLTALAGKTDAASPKGRSA
ncbi:MAG TPA: glycosyltransferase, partial [Nitrospiraceae bacterium]